MFIAIMFQAQTILNNRVEMIVPLHQRHCFKGFSLLVIDDLINASSERHESRLARHMFQSSVVT